MKKLLFVLIALSVAFAFGCSESMTDQQGTNGPHGTAVDLSNLTYYATDFQGQYQWVDQADVAWDVLNNALVPNYDWDAETFTAWGASSATVFGTAGPNAASAPGAGTEGNFPCEYSMKVKLSEAGENFVLVIGAVQSDMTTANGALSLAFTHNGSAGLVVLDYNPGTANYAAYAALADFAFDKYFNVTLRILDDAVLDTSGPTVQVLVNGVVVIDWNGVDGTLDAGSAGAEPFNGGVWGTVVWPRFINGEGLAGNSYMIGFKLMNTSVGATNTDAPAVGKLSAVLQ
jgi:hypothetical protein